MLGALAPCGWVHAQATSASTTQPAPLPFRQDSQDPGFPTAGAVLLVLLIVAAALAWWLRHRRGGMALPRLAVQSSAQLHVSASVRLDLRTRLHVVEWQGRQLLLAVGDTGTPTVVDRIDAPAPTGENLP